MRSHAAPESISRWRTSRSDDCSSSAQDETPESGLRVLLDHPAWCVIVIDAAHDGIGRLTVAEVVKTMSSCPPWMHALELALEPNEATLIAVEL